MRIVPKPKLWRKMWRDTTPRIGYGERKRRKETKKLPLFADDPTLIKSAAQYESEAEADAVAYAQFYRSHRARDWRRLRYELHQLTPEQYAEWLTKWRIYPHDPEYGMGAVTKIRMAI